MLYLQESYVDETNSYVIYVPMDICAMSMVVCGLDPGNIAILPSGFSILPDRPVARGIAPPPGDKVLCRLKEDPKFEEIEELGAEVEKHGEPHTVAGNTVYISGTIPRITAFEEGLFGGRRWVEDSDRSGLAGWISEPVSSTVQ